MKGHRQTPGGKGQWKVFDRFSQVHLPVIPSSQHSQHDLHIRSNCSEVCAYLILQLSRYLSTLVLYSLGFGVSPGVKAQVHGVCDTSKLVRSLLTYSGVKMTVPQSCCIEEQQHAENMQKSKGAPQGLFVPAQTVALESLQRATSPCKRPIQ